MIVKMTAGSLGLLAFSAAIFAGLWAGNGAATILMRAWWSLVLFLIIGAILGCVADVVVQEHIRNTLKGKTEGQAEAASDQTTGSVSAGRVQPAAKG